MSGIFMVCLRCGGRFVAGVVGSTPWPAHVCPDGTRNAPADFAPLAAAVPSREEEKT